jgi:hypothetical protein
LFTDPKGYGWLLNPVSGLQIGRTRDLNASADPRFAGDYFIFNDSSDYFRLNVGAGTYDLRLAAQFNLYIEVYDGDATTPQLVIDRTTNPVNSGYIDASGVVHSSDTNWIANNSPASVSCLSGFLRIRFGSQSAAPGYGSYQHFSIASTGTIDPPTFTDQPDNIEVTLPSTATFNVTLGGGAPTSQVWQTRSSSSGLVNDISGENTNSYTTDATDLSMSGSQYRVAAYWLGGVVYSDWATLTVNAGPPGVIDTTTTDVTSESTCTFSWENGNPPGSSFVVQLESPYNSNNWVTPTGSFSGNSFLATGLTANTDYRFRVRPVNGAGTNSYTNGAVFRVDNLVTGGDTVESAVIFSQTFQWEILGQVTVSRSFNWSILGSVLASYGFNWEILTEVERSFIYAWVIGDTSTGSGEVDYEAVALAVMSYVLPNGKTVAEQLVSLEKQNNVVIALSA